MPPAGPSPRPACCRCHRAKWPRARPWSWLALQNVDDVAEREHHRLGVAEMVGEHAGRAAELDARHGLGWKPQVLHRLGARIGGEVLKGTLEDLVVGKAALLIMRIG